MRDGRKGPFQVEIRQGSWEERLGELLAVERQADPDRARVALLVEGRDEASALAETLLPHLGDAIVRVDAEPGLLLMTEHVERLEELETEDPLLCVAVVGTGNRKDGLRAAWKLGAGLKDRLWVFMHAAVPSSGLVPTVGEHVRAYIDVIEGLAFQEGPKG